MKTSKRSASKKKPANPRLPQCNKILKLFIKLTGIPPDRAAGFKVRQLSEDLSSVAYTSYGHSRIVPLPPALVEPLKKHLEALPHPDERPLFPSKSNVSKPISGRMARYICGEVKHSRKRK